MALEWKPNEKQAEYLSAPEEEVLYGGAAGGGKTDALIVDALGLQQGAPNNPRYRAIILRRSFPQLREVVDRTRTLYPAIIRGAEYFETAREWRFPSGAKIIMGYLERESDCENYQGMEFQFIGFEELTQFPTPYFWDFMRTRLRGTSLKLYMRGTCNPGGPGGRWVQERWRIPDNGGPSEHTTGYIVDGQSITIRRRFIPARATDNLHLPPAYRANLMAQPEAIRAALLDGRWDITDVPGSIYQMELRTARAEGRVTRVPYDPSVPVHVSWDLGIGDATAIWCVQLVGREVHLIDYHEASGEALPYYFRWLEGRGYRYGDDYFPHDAQARELGTGKTREELARANGRRVRIVPRQDVEDGINAARLLMARSWFDENLCKRGLECLQNYRRDYNSRMGEFKATPVHDWASHGADAWRTLAMGLRETTSKGADLRVLFPKTAMPAAAGSWMGS